MVQPVGRSHRPVHNDLLLDPRDFDGLVGQQAQLVVLKTEEERTRADAAARPRYSALVNRGVAQAKIGDYDSAIATLSEAIPLSFLTTLSPLATVDTRTRRKGRMT